MWRTLRIVLQRCYVCASNIAKSTVLWIFSRAISKKRAPSFKFFFQLPQLANSRTGNPTSEKRIIHGQRYSKNESTINFRQNFHRKIVNVRFVTEGDSFVRRSDRWNIRGACNRKYSRPKITRLGYEIPGWISKISRLIGILAFRPLLCVVGNGTCCSYRLNGTRESPPPPPVIFATCSFTCFGCSKYSSPLRSRLDKGFRGGLLRAR